MHFGAVEIAQGALSIRAGAAVDARGMVSCVAREVWLLVLERLCERYMVIELLYEIEGGSCCLRVLLQVPHEFCGYASTQPLSNALIARTET